MLNLDETVLIECIFLRSEKEALDPLPAPMAGRRALPGVSSTSCWTSKRVHAEEGLSAGTRDERTSVVRPRGRTKESAPLTFLQMMLCFQPGGNIFVKNGRRRPGRAIPAVKWSFSSVLCGVTGAGATLRAVAVMGFPFSLFSLFSRHFHLSNAVICSGRTMASSDRSPEDKE